MFNMNVESIAEVKILTQGYQAEYGRSSGLQIMAVTKSGTNQFRGSVYNVRRDSDWNSNSKANILNGVAKTISKQQEFGYSISGPVGKPGGNNKIFFYAHEYAPRTGGKSMHVRFRVPTALERQGDFSQTLDNLGNPYPYIRDPNLSGVCTAADQTACFRDGGVVGRIPANRLYPLGLSILKMWPLPTSSNVVDNFQFGGTLRLDDHGLIPLDLERGADLTGDAGNAWLGLALLHVLFSREHNAIVEMLHKTHPELSDDDTFDKARLINAALMAKIHTVEWTPAVISHPTTRRAMKINWWGLAGERATRRFGRLTSGDLVSGIPGSPTDHNGVPFSLTEEFVAVYRMHPLLPDDYTFRSVADNSVLADLRFPDLDALHMRQRLEEFGMANALYSLGLINPGVVCLHNYPQSLQHFQKPDGSTIDLAATDVMRIRERGVPRYNEFRRLLGMKAPGTFDELTPNPDWARQLREVYDGDIESVDLMVGNYAERLPKGFAFSDTAFRIFILMASRRLKSDRFFTTDYRPARYTEEGLQWVADNTLVSLLLRHFPELSPALDKVENGFHAWRLMGT